MSAHEAMGWALAASAVGVFVLLPLAGLAFAAVAAYHRDYWRREAGHWRRRARAAERRLAEACGVAPEEDVP